MCALPKSKLSSGQAVLIVLLGMAVALTIVLSIVSRSITDISLSTSDEESARAFSAAEAGIENMIIGGPSEADLGTGSYTAGVDNFGEDVGYINFNSDKYYAGETATVWMVSHDDDNNLICDSTHPCYDGRSTFRVCWGNEGTVGTDDSEVVPAIEISFYYSENGNPLGSNPNFSGVKVARAVFDPKVTRRSDNHFSAPAGTSCTVGTEKYAFDSGSLSLPSVISGWGSSTGWYILFARVKFLYNTDEAHVFGVSSNVNFPSQGKLIYSTGTSGGATRTVEVIDLYRSPLGIFEAGLFSGGNLEK